MWEKPGSTRSFNKIVRHHALPTCHAETLIDDPNRIDAPPAHNTIALPVLSRSGPVSTIRAPSRICCPHLPVVQQAGAACTLAVGQPIGTFFVKPMHPVPQCQSLNASPSMPVPQCQSLNVWRSIPPIRAASVRFIPSSTAANAGSRRIRRLSEHRSARRRKLEASKSPRRGTADHREGVQQRPWQISFAMVNHKINEREIPPEPELYQVGII